MKSILFIDTVCPKSYSAYTLENEALGGTEATVVRIAEALCDQGFDVGVEQSPRTGASHATEGRADYMPVGSFQQADYVIVLRNPGYLDIARSRFPNAKLYLWCHDLVDRDFAMFSKDIEGTGTSVIAVSEFHKSQMKDRLSAYRAQGNFRIETLYNPVVTDGVTPNPNYDKNQLIWYSSPHKGLEYALKCFESLRRFNPDFTLLVANPGYFPCSESVPDGVGQLGKLSHRDILGRVSSSLCVFYPNIVFPETFGLVLGEANAVGTPVVTHPFGAAREVLDHPSELVDCRDIKKLVGRVMAWHSGERPIVRAKSQFKLQNVVREWMTKVLK